MEKVKIVVDAFEQRGRELAAERGHLPHPILSLCNVFNNARTVPPNSAATPYLQAEPKISYHNPGSSNPVNCVTSKDEPEPIVHPSLVIYLRGRNRLIAYGYPATLAMMYISKSFLMFHGPGFSENSSGLLVG